MAAAVAASGRHAARRSVCSARVIPATAAGPRAAPASHDERRGGVEPASRPDRRRRGDGHEREHDHRRPDHGDGHVDRPSTRRIEVVQRADRRDRATPAPSRRGRRRRRRPRRPPTSPARRRAAVTAPSRAPARSPCSATSGQVALDHLAGTDDGGGEGESPQRDEHDHERTHRLVDRVDLLAARRLQLVTERTDGGREVVVARRPPAPGRRC